MRPLIPIRKPSRRAASQGPARAVSGESPVKDDFPSQRDLVWRCCGTLARYPGAISREARCNFHKDDGEFIERERDFRDARNGHDADLVQ